MNTTSDKKTGNYGQVILGDEINEVDFAKALPEAKEDFDFEDYDINPVLLSNAMTKFLYDFGGYNVTANFLGHDLRVIVVRGMETAMFNPRVISESEETETMEEGSISHLGLVVKIKRPKTIRVRYQTALGETKTETFIDISARAILNSIDELNGYKFYNRANRYHRDKALKQWKNWKNGRETL